MKQAFGIALVGGFGCIDNSIPAADMDTGVSSAIASEGVPRDWILAAADEPLGNPRPRGASSGSNDPSGDTADGEWCDIGDLQLVAEMRNEGGEPAAFGYPTQSHRLWVRATNPCDTAVELETLGACFVEGWRATAGAISASASFPCGGESGIRRIESGAVMEQEITPFHDLVEGDYAFAVELGVADPETGDRVFVDVDYTVLSRAAR